METGHASYTLELPATVHGPGIARGFARSALATHDPDVVDVVTWLISELVTNAIAHAHSAMKLQIDYGPDTVRVTVEDQSQIGPQVGNPPAAGEGGRGMVLVDALASSWGWEPHEDGKTVWFIL